jgi:hypothetical protein
MQRRTLLMGLGAAAGGAGLMLPLGGCSTPDSPRVITLGEAELRLLVGRAFPVQRRVLEVLDVALTDPVLHLLPEHNRLSVGLSFSTRERLFNAGARGDLAFDSALRFERSDASVRLAQVHVQRLAFAPGQAPTVGGATAALVPRLGLALAERALEDLSIYRLSPERQASLRQWGLAPSAVTVTARGVDITLARAGS